jgi:hypothetical protein
VKALVLISPRQTFKGLTIKKSLEHQAIRRFLSILLIAGTGDTEGQRAIHSIHSRLERVRKPSTDDPEELQKAQSLFLVEPGTSLKGTKMLRARGLNVHQEIARFIQRRLVANKARLPWRERKSANAVD